jgi:hypothetical protein
MSILHFESNFSSTEVDTLDLPVEVRKPDLTLAARSFLSQPVELAPGTYYVSAKLPAGQQLSRTVEVLEGQDALATLTPQPEDESPHQWQEMQHFILGPSETTQQASRSQSSLSGHASPSADPRSSGSIPVERGSELESLGAPGSAAKLRGYMGNILRGEYQVSENQNWLSLTYTSPQDYYLYVVPPGDMKLVQLLQSEAPAINMMLPVWQHQGCQLVVAQQSNGLYTLDAILEHQLANTLLRYMQRGFLEQASTMAVSPALSSEQLLYRKVDEPIAAAVGAYALLRLGDLERLHNWTENLLNFFEWLPDGLTIRGEHLARLGNHDQALNQFLALPTRGLPIFSDGLSYALDRLGLYIRVGEKNFGEVRLKDARTLLEQLQRFAAFVDFRRPLLTFAGIEPGDPSDVTPSGDIARYDGLDISDSG